MDVRVGTASQVKMWWSVEDFDYTVNALNNGYDCKKRLSKPRTTQVDLQ